MTKGQAVVEAARRRLGVSEHPDGSNTGGWIDVIQARASSELGFNYAGTPWCAEAVREWYREAGVPHEWINPYTGAICAHAEREGWFVPASRTAPPGALIIRCGVHVEIIEEDHGSWLAGIGGNVSNAVRRTARARGEWQIIAPPFLGRADLQEVTRVFGFDDPGVAPVLYGGWAEREARERVIGDLAADKRARVRRVNIGGRAPYAFELLAPGDQARWRFGPWHDDAGHRTRDRLMRRREKATGRRMRPWSETRVAGGHRPAPDMTTGGLT